MKKLLAVVGLLLLAPLWAQDTDSAVLTKQVLAKAAPVYGWIADGGVRGVYYSGLRDVTLYDPSAAAGLNCVLNKFGFAPDKPDEGLALHAEAARACKERGMKYFPYINFNSFTERDYTKRQYTPLVDATGKVYAETPSPLDREFWNQSIKRRFVQLAELAKREPLTGVAIDFEMYGSEIIFYDRVGCLDYSDLAFNGFLAQEKLPQEQVAPAQRVTWLTRKHLSDKYEAYYRSTLEAICRDIEQATHAANPDFIVGFYSWNYNSPFYEACARGFGTEKMPALLWPGTTYSSGYSVPEVDNQVRLLGRIGAHCVFIPGLWLWQFHADNLAANAYLSAKQAGGYWLYGIYSMWSESATKRKVPHVKAEDFWAALKRANDEIIAVRKDPQHQSALKVDLSRSLFLGIDPATLAKPVKLRLLEAAPAIPPLDKQIAAPIRYTGVYRAFGEQGKKLTFRVMTPRLGGHTNGTVASLLGPDHKVLAEEQVGVGETKDMVIECPATGTYTVVAQTGNLCSYVVSDAPGFVLDGTDGLHLMTRVQPLYFMVPPGVKEFTFTGTGQGVERFDAGIVAPDGTVVAHAENIGNTTVLKVAVPAGQDGQIWTLDLKPPADGVLEDVTVQMSSNIPPYFARERERLLVP
ncbi:MAG: hypothetical protein ABFE08_02080 [Armatimonadia bacterium]